MPPNALGRVAQALARSLAEERGEGEAPGANLGEIISSSAHAECLACGIKLSGAELIAAGLLESAGGAAPSKLNRIRLGYCARNGCDSRFYRIRLAPVEGVPWPQVWARAEALISAPSAEPPEAEAREAAPRAPLFAGLAENLRKPALYPPLAATLLLASVFVVRSGCYIPGITPKPQVFIVPEIPWNAPSEAVLPPEGGLNPQGAP